MTEDGENVERQIQVKKLNHKVCIYMYIYLCVYVCLTHAHIIEIIHIY